MLKRKNKYNDEQIGNALFLKFLQKKEITYVNGNEIGFSDGSKVFVYADKETLYCSSDEKYRGKTPTKNLNILVGKEILGVGHSFYSIEDFYNASSTVVELRDKNGNNYLLFEKDGIIFCSEMNLGIANLGRNNEQFFKEFDKLVESLADKQ
ncbi:MAG: hypothetical protein J7K26_01135 [Candidatus Aenigmarchaeota archaeon]|nr:hypothetical protein [Candidatus Aenigmarchaeota archaeon]